MNDRISHQHIDAAQTPIGQPLQGSDSRPAGGTGGRLLQAGHNCRVITTSPRVALLVDADNYFRAFARAALNARHSLHILGWDFDSRTHLNLDFDEPENRELPAELGDFLNYLVRRRRSLHIHILDWDYPMVFGTDREFPPVYGLGWNPRRRVHLRYDNTHPVGGSHHQKIVVIDNVLAFSGGIDLTSRRWDTRRHSPDDQRRMADGTPYPPFHDVMVMVDGDTAGELGRIVRERWLHATGEHLPSVPSRPERDPDPWPTSLAPDIIKARVGISRTEPARDELPAVTEIEALYLDLIRHARHSIYIENQYFTAYKLAEALEARLAEPDGPEVIVVLRLLSHGWLEEHTMQALRTRLVARLRAADRWSRFGVYYPHIPGLRDGTCVDVHSKVTIVDDQWLRIGSANFCNRSMGVDTECDLTLEADGDVAISKAIRDFRNALLAEHLDVAAAQVATAHEQAGSLNTAIATLHKEGRTLEPLPEEDRPELEMGMATIADPETPVSLDQLIHEFSPDVSRHASIATAGRARIGLVLGFALLFGALAAAWRYTPLAEWLTIERVTAFADSTSAVPWAPLVVMIAYTPACLIMFPRPLITLFATVAFGAQMGFVYAISGILLAALATYMAGRYMNRDQIRRLAGPRLNRLSEMLRRRGLLAVTAVRLVPVAPFAVEGMVAGAIRVKSFDYLAGTMLGMLPGTLTTTVFGDQFEALLREPERINYGLIAGVVACVLVLAWLGRRWFRARYGETPA